MSPKRTLLPLLLLGFLALPSRATWSIVCVNLRTREVGVASATCLADFNLRVGVPVVVVGEGAAAAQSFVDQSGANRRTIYFSFRDTERTPQEILDLLAMQDLGHQTRQYGIVNFSGEPVTFTGTRDGLAATGVRGQIGDYLYAIQGNVLTGNQVVFAAEAAFRGTKGDMGQKLMAAMHAARALGGDGRCSCSDRAPTSCGVPPPDFEKSAHVGVLIVARVGDTDGGCSAVRGCADGEYYLLQNVVHGGVDDPDPVFTLQTRYDYWRKARVGRPDGILSRVTAVKSLPADGATERTVVVELFDIDDRPLGHGGAQVEVATADGLSPLATVGTIVDRGDGTYAFTLRAGTQAGLDRFVITASDDLVRATLYPYLEVRTVAAAALHAGYDAVSAAQGARIPFVVNEPAKPRGRFTIVARVEPASASLPGPLLPVGQSPFFPSAPGALDAAGRAEALLEVPPGALGALVGLRIDWTGRIVGHGAPATTNTVGLSVLP